MPEARPTFKPRGRTHATPSPEPRHEPIDKFDVPSIHSLVADDAGGGVRMRTILIAGHNVRRPRVGENCDIVRAVNGMDDNLSFEAALRVMMHPANGWKPHHSLEALIDQFAPSLVEAENEVWRAAHVTRLQNGEFARMRGSLERFLMARAGELAVDDLRKLAGWMNKKDHHPNPHGWFSQRAVLRLLPAAFVDTDLPRLRGGPAA